MSLDTLLTIALAGALLLAGAIVRMCVLGVVRVVRLLSGRPTARRERPHPEDRAVGRALTGGVARVVKRVGEGVAALVAVVAATASTWWREEAQPSLVDARQAGLAHMTEHPEASGEPDVLVRIAPINEESFASQREDEKQSDMQLV